MWELEVYIKPVPYPPFHYFPFFFCVYVDCVCKCRDIHALVWKSEESLETATLANRLENFWGFPCYCLPSFYHTTGVRDVISTVFMWVCVVLWDSRRLTTVSVLSAKLLHFIFEAGSLTEPGNRPFIIKHQFLLAPLSTPAPGLQRRPCWVTFHKGAKDPIQFLIFSALYCLSHCLSPKFPIVFDFGISVKMAFRLLISNFLLIYNCSFEKFT